jgi:hypothetical protein
VGAWACSWRRQCSHARLCGWGGLGTRAGLGGGVGRASLGVGACALGRAERGCTGPRGVGRPRAPQNGSGTGGEALDHGRGTWRGERGCAWAAWGWAGQTAGKIELDRGGKRKGAWDAGGGALAWWAGVASWASQEGKGGMGLFPFLSYFLYLLFFLLFLSLLFI